jgi:hypothetical protein
MALEFKKELAGVEDMLFGFGTVEQSRGAITRINSSHIPNSDSESVLQALDNRFTESESDSRYARTNGNANNIFEVAVASGGAQAPQMDQVQTMVNARAAKTDVILKGDTTAYVPLYDNDPTNKVFVENAVQDLRDNTLLKNNTAEFNPIGDYNPSTKKYVDDAVAPLSSNITTTFTTTDGKTITVENGLITGVV